jgi:hypothetical protein
MNYTIGTRHDPCTLHIRISSLKPCKLRLQVIDQTLANTFLADRDVLTTAGSTHDCYVPLPLSPWIAFVRIYDQNGQPGSPDGFTVEAITKMGLQTYRQAIDWNNPEIAQAIRLGSSFCYNAGWLPVLPQDEAYCSPDQSLKLKYLSTLVNPQSGTESVTPMRISQSTAIMEASQTLVVPFTVPGRAVMYYHEVSHKYENKNPDWELEADLNGLTIYLALGFSRYEALQVYKQVFGRVNSPENQDRMLHIERFINDFEHYINTKY